MRYGELPVSLGVFNIKVDEVMLYQYLPVKMAGEVDYFIEPRLTVFEKLFGVIFCDYIGTRSLDDYVNSYIYVTAKRRFVTSECPMNRHGYHSDSFLSEDINYIYSDCFPTIFNTTEFRLSPDDRFSLVQMTQQARKENEVTYRHNELLRLTQYNIHKVAPVTESRMRTFLKVSFSKDKYGLAGNSHNSLISYDWKMRPRSIERNVPQEIKSE